MYNLQIVLNNGGYYYDSLISIMIANFFLTYRKLKSYYSWASELEHEVDGYPQDIHKGHTTAYIVSEFL